MNPELTRHPLFPYTAEQQLNQLHEYCEPSSPYYDESLTHYANICNALNVFNKVEEMFIDDNMGYSDGYDEYEITSPTL